MTNWFDLDKHDFLICRQMDIGGRVLNFCGDCSSPFFAEDELELLCDVCEESIRKMFESVVMKDIQLEG